MIRRLRPETLLVVCVLLAGCSGGSDYFSLEVPWNSSRPELTDFRLTTDMPGVADITDPGRAYNYPVDTAASVPGVVVLRWRAQGEPQYRLATFRVRENVPSAVMRKIHSSFGGQPEHLLMLRFSVIDGVPECLWVILRGGPGDPGPLSGGKIAGTISSN